MHELATSRKKVTFDNALNELLGSVELPLLKIKEKTLNEFDVDDKWQMETNPMDLTRSPKHTVLSMHEKG